VANDPLDNATETAEPSAPETSPKFEPTGFESDQEFQSMLDEYNRSTAEPKEATPDLPAATAAPEDDDALLERALNGALSNYEKAVLKRQGINPDFAMPHEIRDAFAKDALYRATGKVQHKLMEYAHHLKQHELEVIRKRDEHDYRLLIREFRKADEFSDKSDEFLSVLLDGAHARSEVFRAAWRDRETKPLHYERTVRRLIRECAKAVGPVYDANVSEDREAVSHFMRGGSTNTRPPQRQVNLNNLSDQEFANFTEREFGYRSRVGG
jgi:hypothetical protein